MITYILNIYIETCWISLDLPYNYCMFSNSLEGIGMAKSLSAGVVITNGTSILLCHVTGNKHWDLPKGKVESGEHVLNAAIRECFEETSIKLQEDQLVDLGIFKYKKDKDLHLFLQLTADMPDTDKLDCSSTFDSGKGIHKKEMDAFANVTWDKIHKKVLPDMLRVLMEVKDQL